MGVILVQCKRSCRSSLSIVPSVSGGLRGGVLCLRRGLRAWSCSDGEGLGFRVEG